MSDITVTNRFYKPSSQPVGGEVYLKLYYNKQTGAVRLSQVNQIGVEFDVYKDGVWQFNPGAVNTLEEKLKVHDLVKKTIETKVFPNLKPTEVKAQFVVQKAESKDIPGGGQDPTPSKDSTGAVGAALNFFEDVSKLGIIQINKDQFQSKNMKVLFPATVAIKYPRDMSESQDRLSIAQYEYQSPYKDAFETPTKELFKKGIQRNRALAPKTKLSTIFLPMPNDVKDSNEVTWGGEKMSSYQIAAAGNLPEVGKVAAAYQGAKTFADITKDMPGGLGRLGQMAGELTKTPALRDFYLMAKLGGGLDNPIAQAAFQSAILKAAGVEVDSDTILARGHGVIPNSNLELLFNGPTLRNFTFSYRMSPRDELEANDINRIIRYFKQGMATKKSNASNSNAGGSSAILATPNVFKLRYLSGSKPISGVNKFKICALRNVNVSYSPDGQWAAYDKGQPASIIMTLSFSELEPIYESDYQEQTVNGLNDDYEPITPNDIGY